MIAPTTAIRTIDNTVIAPADFWPLTAPNISSTSAPTASRISGSSGASDRIVHRLRHGVPVPVRSISNTADFDLPAC